MNKKAIFGLVCVFLLGFGLYCCKKLSKQQTENITWDGSVYLIENVNSFDRPFAHSYNKVIDKIGDGLVIAESLFVIILIVIAGAEARKNKKKIVSTIYSTFIFACCLIYSLGIYGTLKHLVGRLRPYMYFPNPNFSGINEGDFCLSWPSGHSALSSTIAFFGIWWLLSLKTEILPKKPIIITLCLCFVVTGISRILAGCHFPTDVLTGWTLGFLVSSFVTLICKMIVKNQLDD